KIPLGLKGGQSKYRSTMEFMSMDKQASKIFSWRGDWINLDEAALIDQLDQALMNLSTRLTGKTSRGREFLGRMSLMTNPWDNESAGPVYYFYALAIGNPERALYSGSGRLEIARTAGYHHRFLVGQRESAYSALYRQVLRV